MSNEKDKRIVSYCFYCKEAIFEGEGMIKVDGVYYHYDTENRLKSCWFPETKDEE